MKLKKKHYLLILAVLFITGVTVQLHYNAVDNALTDDDLKYIPLYLQNTAALPKAPDFKDEL